jgi:hypothetical protein
MLWSLIESLIRCSDMSRDRAQTGEVEALLRQYQDEVEGARKQWLHAERKEMILQKEKVCNRKKETRETG